MIFRNYQPNVLWFVVEFQDFFILIRDFWYANLWVLDLINLSGLLENVQVFLCNFEFKKRFPIRFLQKSRKFENLSVSISNQPIFKKGFSEITSHELPEHTASLSRYAANGRILGKLPKRSKWNYGKQTPFETDIFENSRIFSKADFSLAERVCITYSLGGRLDTLFLLNHHVFLLRIRGISLDFQSDFFLDFQRLSCFSQDSGGGCNEEMSRHWKNGDLIQMELLELLFSGCSAIRSCSYSWNFRHFSTKKEAQSLPEIESQSLVKSAANGVSNDAEEQPFAAGANRLEVGQEDASKHTQEEAIFEKGKGWKLTSDKELYQACFRGETHLQ